MGLMEIKDYLNIHKLKSQPLFVNVASLSLVQIANYIVPIIIIPIVVRALGVECFGKVSYAQNIISYLTIIVNYGFEYSATQDVAINRNNKLNLRTIFWTVIRFKLLLLILSFIALLILYLTFSKVSEDPTLYFYAALINVGQVMFPTWFFQGLEKMKNMAMFNFAVKALGAVLTVLLVQTPNDYKDYVLILSLSYVFVGIFSFFYLIKKYDLKVDYRNKQLSKKVIYKGFPVFLNNIFVSFYTVAGMTIVGLYLSNKDIGLYSGANRIIVAVMMLTSMPINIALFPVMSRKFDQSKKEGWACLKKYLALVSIGGAIISLLIYFFSPLIVEIFLGEKFTESIPLLRLFAPLPFLVITASMLTVQGMYGMQMQKYAPYVGVFLSILSICLNLLLVPSMGGPGAAIAWLTAQFFEIIIVGTLLKLKTKV